MRGGIPEDYDALGRVLEIENPESKIVNTYDGRGNRLSVTTGATETTQFQYDGLDRRNLPTNFPDYSCAPSPHT